MGRKVRWFDTVQKILSTSEPDPVETQTEAKHEKAAKLRDKPSFKKIWPFGRSNSSGASTSAAPALAPDTETHQPQLQQSPGPVQQHVEEIATKAQFVETGSEKGESICPAEVVSPSSKVSAAYEAAATIAHPIVTSPRVWAARSKEDIAATRIQAACRGYLVRRGPQESGVARLMSLVEGFAVRRQTEEALFCMQAMTRIQTQIYSRRAKTEEDKKALKGQIKVKQNLDKTKIGEGWDHSLQSKEQMEAVLVMKQEAASRRQRALSYAFSQQWRNKNPTSARAATAPTFMDPGNLNWGWSWTERWMAAARPWENQTAAPDNGRAATRSASRLPRVAISVQIPTAGTPKGKPFRPPNWPSSLSSPSTPPPRSPSLSGRMAMPASPRSSSLHAASGLQRTKSLQLDRCQELSASSPRRPVPASPCRSGSPLHTSSGMQHATTTMRTERRPRSSQELSASSPHRPVPASPKGSRSSSPLHTSSSLQHVTTTMRTERRPRNRQELSAISPRRSVPVSPRGGRSGSPLHTSSGMQHEHRPRSSQDRGVSSPRLGAGDAAPLRRTTSLRAELPRRLSLGSAAVPVGTGDDAGAPVTPSYMQSTKSVKAKVRCPSPSALTTADMFDAPENGPPLPLQLPSPSSAKKRMSLAFADKPSASSPSKATVEKMRRHSQPPSPRMPPA